ncbi:hypothetical protein DPMN_123370 [Dreissena polymorpha]|uniref:Uncharacterized protein n=1 Tax=Dreissena polymorpha TaxID=45954 RepID=A0A9D4GR68_DREPO|nr:hypothetical protein DPMN_123370 [Dreissena polymorpha]
MYSQKQRSYNDDDDDVFEEAGFEPSSSNNAEKDSSTGTSCFKNRLESASSRDTADNDDDDDEEAGFEPSSSDSAEMDSATGTSCFKNRQERASLNVKAVIIINDQLSFGCYNDDDDEEAGFEPSSSNSAEIMDSATSTSCYKNRQERTSLRTMLLVASEETMTPIDFEVTRYIGRDSQLNPIDFQVTSSIALLEEDTSSSTSGYKYREERASVREWLQKLGEDQSHHLKTLFKTKIALRKELERENKS